MNFRKVTAILRCESCEKVEQKLQELGVHGLSISKVKGYGEYANLYSNDWLVTHARIEIFTEASKAEEIAEAIMEAGTLDWKAMAVVSPTVGALRRPLDSGLRQNDDIRSELRGIKP